MFQPRAPTANQARAGPDPCIHVLCFLYVLNGNGKKYQDWLVHSLIMFLSFGPQFRRKAINTSLLYADRMAEHCLELGCIGKYSPLRQGF